MAIVKMRRLRLFGMASDREILMKRLQELGCVEIDEPGEKLKDPAWAALVKRPDDKCLARTKEARTAADQALSALKKYAPPKRALLKARPVITEAALFDETAKAAALAVTTAINDGERRVSALYAEESKLKNQRAQLAPWLDLDVPLETASTPDVTVLFGTVSGSAVRNEVEAALAEVTELAELSWAGTDREAQYLLFLCHKGAEDAALDVMKNYGFSRTGFRDLTGTARENTDRLNAELAALGQDLVAVKAEIASQAPQRDAIKLYFDRVDQEVSMEESKLRLLDTKATFFLDGWVPVPEETALSTLLAEFTCCWETEDPLAEDYPQVPIKLKSNVFTEPLNMITEMYSLPAYDGVDPNPLMAPFYIFFFGFMFADLAYGLILAGVSLLVTLKVKPKGGTGQLFRLMVECGISSAVIGFFTGGFFSDSISRICGILGTEVPQIPFLTVNPVFDVMRDPMTVLVITLGIGLVQIVFGMGVSAYMSIRDGHWIDALCDVGTWWLVFIGIGVLGVTGSWYVLAAGGVAIVLTQGRNGKGILGKLTGILASLYNNVTGYFGDILSYSRLMVMMLAGSVIGQVFNILGAMPGNLFFFFIVFVIGHAFNMGLNVIGTYVHTSRLQYLEFFGKFYKEGGRPFKPLQFSTKYVDIKEEQ